MAKKREVGSKPATLESERTAELAVQQRALEHTPAALSKNVITLPKAAADQVACHVQAVLTFPCLPLNFSPNDPT